MDRRSFVGGALSASLSPQLLAGRFSHRGRVVWIEFKKPGEKPRLAQTLEHDRMKAAGAEVYTCDSVVEALKILGIV